MRLMNEVPSELVEVQLSFMLSAINHANVISALLTFVALCVLAMMIIVVQELKELDDDC